MSTIALTITNKNDNAADLDEEIYSLKSDLTVISLRLPVVYDMSFGGFGINVGLNLLIPVAGDAPTSSTTITDANTTNYVLEDKDAAAQEDLIASLGHLKSGFGAEVVMGMYFAF